ncbi:trimethylguanosine synthase, partial [Planctomycetaceae bacterium]|nr:trimethylguanosine synthase [Planctomycetaceae bacterium]
MSNIPSHIPLNAECCQFLELIDQNQLFGRIAKFEGNELKLQTELRQDFSSEMVSSALTQVDLRLRGAEKFTLASQMWFDRRGLEQSTAEPISHHKSQRFEGDVWDLCCGLGGDAIGLAGQCRVTAVDLNPASCLQTWLNAGVYQCQDQINVRCEDVTTLDLAGKLVHIDPDRRPQGNRVIRMEDAEPGLPFLKELMQSARGGAIKLSPAA